MRKQEAEGAKKGLNIKEKFGSVGEKLKSKKGEKSDKKMSENAAEKPAKPKRTKEKSTKKETTNKAAEAGLN